MRVPLHSASRIHASRIRAPRVPAPRFRAGGPVVALAVAALSGGCADSVPDPPGLGCTVLVAPPAAPDPVTASDSLDVIVSLPARSEPVETLVRVDSIAAEGIVLFPADVPPTASAVGATLTTRAIYSVCISSAPRAVVFQGEPPPHGKIWVRVSSDRPVRTVVRVGERDAQPLGPALVVTPGTSGRMRWDPDGEGP